MKLTGKTKEAFFNYLNELPVAPYEVMLGNIPECYLNALIIEFFDSVKIYIDIDLDKYIDNVIFDACVDAEWIGTSFRTRSEATMAAIKYANDLYNEIK